MSVWSYIKKRDIQISLVFSFIALVISAANYATTYHLNSEQIKEISAGDSTRSVDYMLRFDDKIFSGRNLLLGNAIDKGYPLLKRNGGQFTTDDFDNFLGVYNQLNDAYNLGLVSDDLLMNNFSDQLKEVGRNKEIQDYLKTIRTENPDYFLGIDDLVQLANT